MLAERMNRLGTETAFEVLAKAQAMEAEGRNIIHLEIGEPDFDTPQHIVDSAVDALKSYTPDVIFVDLIMPNIDGKRLCKVIRRINRFDDTFLVILSSFASEEKIDIAELNVDACISKGPLDEMTNSIIAALIQSDHPLQYAFKMPFGSKEFLGDSPFKHAFTFRDFFYGPPG